MRAALIAAVLAIGCRYDLDTYEADTECEIRQDIAVCVEAESHSDYTWLQANVFSSNCSGDACHNPFKNGKPPGGKIVLVGNDAGYTSLLGPAGTGATSDVEPGRVLVSPGFPDDSYLLFLLHGIDPTLTTARQFNEPPEDVGYMPRDNNTLCCQKIDAVRRWIAAGAAKD